MSHAHCPLLIFLSRLCSRRDLQRSKQSPTKNPSPDRLAATRMMMDSVLMVLAYGPVGDKLMD